MQDFAKKCKKSGCFFHYSYSGLKPASFVLNRNKPAKRKAELRQCPKKREDRRTVGKQTCSIHR